MKFREVKIGDYVNRPTTRGGRELIKVTGISDSGKFLILRLGFKDETLVGYPNEEIFVERGDER